MGGTLTFFFEVWFSMKYFLALLGLIAVNGLELTSKNWEEKTDGKTVFIKFLAPW